MSSGFTISVHIIIISSPYCPQWGMGPTLFPGSLILMPRRARRDPGTRWSHATLIVENIREGSSVIRQLAMLGFVEFKVLCCAGTTLPTMVLELSSPRFLGDTWPACARVSPRLLQGVVRWDPGNEVGMGLLTISVELFILLPFSTTLEWPLLCCMFSRGNESLTKWTLTFF